MPFFCYNKKDYCDHSENCDGCDVWVQGKGGKEVPSKADSIRAMSDEELADWLARTQIDNISEALKIAGFQWDQHPDLRELTAKDNLEWLKQPAGDK